MHPSNWSGAVRFGLPGLLVGVVLAGGFGTFREPFAQAQGLKTPTAERPKSTAPAGDASSTIAFTSQSNTGGQLLYLIDTHTRAFAIYQVDPDNPKGKVKLEAVRRYDFDLKLSEYNNQSPEVAAIESMVKKVPGTTRH
jgi:hypothetical protein